MTTPLTPAHPVSPKTLGARILRSRLGLALATNSKVSQEQLGEIVATELGRAKPISGATVSRWEADLVVPDLATLGAIARVCSVDPGWLAFGEESAAPTPWAHLKAVDRLYTERLIASGYVQSVEETLIRQAAAQDKARIQSLTARLRELANNDSPSARREAREIIAALDAPSSLDVLARTLWTDEDRAARDRGSEDAG